MLILTPSRTYNHCAEALGAIDELVTAITVRVIPEGGGVDGAATDVTNATTPSSVPVILDSMIASNRIPHLDFIYYTRALRVEER